MKTYEYRGFDSDGRALKGLVEALNVKDAREKLAADGVLAERVALARHHARWPIDSRATVYRELGGLLRAGLPLVRGLDILIDAPELARVRSLLASVRDSVRDGASLAESLSDVSRSVSPFERAIIEAAEQAASVEVMLESLASFLEESERLRERVQNALIYPCIVLTVGICVALVMLGVLVPRAQDLLVTTDLPVPALTAFMIGLGRVTLRWVAPVVALLVAGLAYAWRKGASDVKFRAQWGRRVFNMPVLGRGYEILVSLRFARTLTILLNGGVSLIEGLVLAGRATGNAWVSDLAEEKAEQMRHGISLSEAVRQIPPLASSLPGWIHVGEAGGGLAGLLGNAARRLQDRWDRYITRVLGLLEPILILIIGVFVLLVTLSVLLPVMGLTQAVTN